MTSRKRSRPEDDSPAPPYRTIVVSAQEGQKEPERVLADRQLLLTVPRGSIGIQNLSSFALAVALDTYKRTERYVAIFPDLNGLQRASLTAVLSILSEFFSRDYATLRFATSLNDAIRAGDGALASLADKINQGLVAFLTHGCDCQQSNAPDSAPSSGLSTGSSSSSAAATTREPKRGRLSKISGTENQRGMHNPRRQEMFYLPGYSMRLGPHNSVHPSRQSDSQLLELRRHFPRRGRRRSAQSRRPRPGPRKLGYTHEHHLSLPQLPGLV